MRAAFGSQISADRRNNVCENQRLIFQPRRKTWNHFAAADTNSTKIFV